MRVAAAVPLKIGDCPIGHRPQRASLPLERGRRFHEVTLAELDAALTQDVCLPNFYFHATTAYVYRRADGRV
jgi:Domain of unknown function (DUF1993)